MAALAVGLETYGRAPTTAKSGNPNEKKGNGYLYRKGNLEILIVRQGELGY